MGADVGEIDLSQLLWVKVEKAMIERGRHWCDTWCNHFASLSDENEWLSGNLANQIWDNTETGKLYHLEEKIECNSIQNSRQGKWWWPEYIIPNGDLSLPVNILIRRIINHHNNSPPLATAEVCLREGAWGGNS